MRTATFIFLITAGALGHAAAADQDVRRFPVQVDRVVIDARAVDGQGRPLLGLTAADFRVKVDGKPVVLESATWIEGKAPDEPLPRVDGAMAPVGDVVAGGVPKGRLMVFLFQKDFHPSRLNGLMMMQQKAVKFLETLAPEDRVAVMSIDTQLRLWQDFTADQEKLRHAIRRSVFFGKFSTGQSVEAPSLAAHFDFDGAKKVGTPETALLVTARALKPLPGAKSLVFFGHGMGRLSWPYFTMNPDYGPAAQALLDARTTVFTLDVTNADYHTLELGLEQVARDTGGFYAKTHLFPAQAMTRLEGAVAGHYVLAFPRPPSRAGAHRVEVKLVGRKGEVLAKDSYVD